ncbi:hypothetical protein O181_060371 [Austropuccinia psidii MF-1]|uniref:Uncharacterized protein n=1 Tax=Austropuccinia psidii MF-1 TaxID=1389203 RepID=A0A9Q3EKT9_9BASI|nr:hypothetical protein [Austropuccinia psidii MF-1]
MASSAPGSVRQRNWLGGPLPFYGPIQAFQSFQSIHTRPSQPNPHKIIAFHVRSSFGDFLAPIPILGTHPVCSLNKLAKNSLHLTLSCLRPSNRA